MRDSAISFIKHRNLKSKLYREETLTLAKLMEIVSQYHDKEVLILVRENVNNIATGSKQGGNVGGAIKWVTSPRNVIALVITSLENVENLAILKFAVTKNSLSRIGDKHRVEVRVVVMETPVENFSMERTRKPHKAEEM